MSASKRRPLGSSFGAAKDLKKASPKKFVGIKSRLGSTGSHAGNQKTRVDRSKEPFKRIGRNTLAKLVNATLDNEESIYELAPSDMLSMTTIADSAEVDLRQRLAETEYILLDCRDEEAYMECHIEGGWLRTFVPCNIT